MRFSNGREGQGVLNIVFSVNCYVDDMVMEVSKDLLILSIGNVTYAVWNCGLSKPVSKLCKITVQRYTGKLHVTQ